MKFTFEYDKEDKRLTVISDEKKYAALEHLGNWWKISDIQSIKEFVQQAQEDETIEDFTIDGSTGFIWVYPDTQSADVFTFYSDKEVGESLLVLTLPEVVEFLTLMEDFLKNNVKE